MNGPEDMGEAGVSPVPERDMPSEVQALPLAEVQKFAAARRSVAEDLLAEARDFEQRVGALAEVANAAIAGERKAAEDLRLARVQLAALVASRERDTLRYREWHRTEEAAAAELTAAQARRDSARAAYDRVVSARPPQPPTAADAAAAESEARADVDAAAQRLCEAQSAREQADTQLLALRGGIEAPSGASGLSAEASQRVAERRVADALRNRVQRGAM